jgi:hypothetical protein
MSARIRMHERAGPLHLCHIYKIQESLRLSVVDLARPGVGRGRDSRSSVAGNVASDAAEGLDLRASVGRHLDGAGPVPVQALGILLSPTT